MKYHLAILTPGWIELILDGSKMIESRFTKVRCAPFGKVNAGDIVYLKESGGRVKGMFTVAKVETHENLNRSGVQAIYERCGMDIFYQSFTRFFPPEKWLTAKHATLIYISNPVEFEMPFPFPKRDPRAWVVLDSPLHKCEMCNERYLLEVYETPDGEHMHGSQHLCSSCYARECVSPDEEVALAEADSV